MTLRKRLYRILEPSEKGGTIERFFEWTLVLIILLNIIAIILESVPGYHDEYGLYFRAFELFSIACFTIEYVARLYAIVENPRYSHPVKGRLAYAVTPLAIIDLLSFLPFYLHFMGYLRFLRIFRLMALFRMFKIARYLHALQLFKRVMKERREQLVLTLIFLVFILVFISFAMFYVENEAQPEVFSSIPAAMWWGIMTLTTVGYGDIVPITDLGKFLSGIFSICCVAILALPVAIVTSGFLEMIQSENRKSSRCPHCGGELHPD